MSYTYRYSLRRSTGEWLAKSGQSVLTQTSPQYHFEGIKNWADIRIKTVRNLRLSGFVYEATETSLEFVNDLAFILRHEYYNFGLGHKVLIYIERQIGLAEWQTEIAASVDLPLKEDTNNSFVAPLIFEGVMNTIKLLEETQFEISVTGQGVQTTEVLPQILKGRARWSASSIPIEEVNGSQCSLYYRLIDDIQLGEPIRATADTYEVKPLFVIESELKTATITGEIYFNIGNATGSNETYTIRLVTPVASTVLYTVNLAGGANTNGNITVNDTISNVSTGSVFLVFEASHNRKLTPTGSANWDLTLEAGRAIEVNYEYYTSSFQATGVNMYWLLGKLIDKMLGYRFPFESDLLSTPVTYSKYGDFKPNSLLICSEQCLNGTANPVIKISLKQLMDALQTWIPCGLYVERDSNNNETKVRVEGMDFFFKQKDNNGNLNIITDFYDIEKNSTAIFAADDHFYSKLEIGYEPAEIDEVNAVDDVHCTNIYTIDNVITEKSITLKSSIIASPFAIYKAVTSLRTNTNRTRNTSNENFVIQVNDVADGNGIFHAAYPTDIDPSAYVTGITDSTRFLNSGLTPAKCAIRNSYYLLSRLPHSANPPQDNVLRFRATDRNKDLKTKMTTPLVVYEGMDINVWFYANHYKNGRDFGRLFYPEVIKFTAPSFEDYNALWAANRFGVFAVYLTLPDADPTKIDTTKYPVYIFPLESANQTANNDTYEFYGLVTASNNMQRFIK